MPASDVDSPVNSGSDEDDANLTKSKLRRRRYLSSSDEEDNVIEKPNTVAAPDAVVVADRKPGASKMMEKLQSLRSYDEIMKEEAQRRMFDGLKTILELHTPYELSSLCGQLGLQVQLKAMNSLELIMDYVFGKKKNEDARLKKVLSSMWEGAFFEYLRSIGHPQHSQLVDPKQTVMKIWMQGGLLDNGRSFIPHFIAREVKNRYAEGQSEDIALRLAKIRITQEQTKAAERKIISDHDYTNILEYFRNIGSLRSIENEARDFFIGELEGARRQLDSEKQAAAFHREQLDELETFCMDTVEHLNEKLAHSEYLRQDLMKERCEIQSQMHRLVGILDSFVASAKNRSANSTSDADCDNPLPLTLKEPEKCCQMVQTLHNKLLDFRDMFIDGDDTLRERCRQHVEEIRRLESHIRTIEDRLEVASQRAEFEQKRAERAEQELQSSAKKMMKMSSKTHFTAQESWAFGMRSSLIVQEEIARKKRVENLIIAGMLHTNPLISRLCRTLMLELNIASADKISEINERAKMAVLDKEGKALRVFEFQQELKKKSIKRTVVSGGSPEGGKKKKGKDKKSGNETETSGDEKSTKSAKTTKSKKSDEGSSKKAKEDKIGQKGGEKSPAKKGKAKK